MIQFKSLPVIPLRITSGYGKRDTGIPGATAWHDGVDMGRNKAIYTGSHGGPVLAVLPGRVCSSYYNSARGYVVMVDHGTIDRANVKTLYQHLASTGLPVGSVVKAGQQVGIMGASGVGAGLHLHFELRIGDKCVDPTSYLKNIKKQEEEMTEEQVKAIVKKVLSESKDQPSSWASADWAEATKLGITDGTKPQAYITREQVATMIMRAVKAIVKAIKG